MKKLLPCFALWSFLWGFLWVSPLCAAMVKGEVRGAVGTAPVQVALQSMPFAGASQWATGRAAAGRFSLREAPAAVWRRAVLAWQPGHEKAPGRFAWRAVRPEDLGSVVLRLEPLQWASVTVRDENGKPLRGVRVRPKNWGEDFNWSTLPSAWQSRMETRSDAQGRARIALPPGGAKVELLAPGRAAFDVNVKPGQTPIITMPRAVSLRLRVEHNGAPLPGVKVRLTVQGKPVDLWRREYQEPNALVTDANGEVRFNDLPPGKIYARLPADGTQAQPYGGSAEAEIAAGESKELTIAAQKIEAVRVSGKLLWDEKDAPPAQGGQPLGGRWVHSGKGTFSATVQTAPDGIFSFWVPRGKNEERHFFTVRDSDVDDYMLTPRFVLKSDDKELILPPTKFRYAPPRRIVVVDAKGKAADEATVGFYAGDYDGYATAQTQPVNAQGETVVRGIVADMSLRFWAKGNGYFSDEVQAKPGDTAPVTLRLTRRGVALAGTVRDQNGAPLRGARIELTPRRHSFAVSPILSNTRGEFQSAPLLPGEYIFLLTHPDALPLKTSVTTSDKTQRSVWSLQTLTSVVRGTVQNESGQGIAGARVWFMDGAPEITDGNGKLLFERPSQVIADAQGHFQIARLRSGPCWFFAQRAAKSEKETATPIAALFTNAPQNDVRLIFHEGPIPPRAANVDTALQRKVLREILESALALELTKKTEDDCYSPTGDLMGALAVLNGESAPPNGDKYQWHDDVATALGWAAFDAKLPQGALAAAQAGLAQWKQIKEENRSGVLLKAARFLALEPRFAVATNQGERDAAIALLLTPAINSVHRSTEVPARVETLGQIAIFLRVAGDAVRSASLAREAAQLVDANAKVDFGSGEVGIAAAALAPFESERAEQLVTRLKEKNHAKNPDDRNDYEWNMMRYAIALAHENPQRSAAIAEDLWEERRDMILAHTVRRVALKNRAQALDFALKIKATVPRVQALLWIAEATAVEDPKAAFPLLEQAAQNAQGEMFANSMRPEGGSLSQALAAVAATARRFGHPRATEWAQTAIALRPRDARMISENSDFALTQDATLALQISLADPGVARDFLKTIEPRLLKTKVDTIEGNTQYALLAAWQADPATAARWLSQWPAHERANLASVLASWALESERGQQHQLEGARNVWGDF